MVASPFDLTIQVGEVHDAAPFPETNKAQMVKLWIDLGDEQLQSCAQLGYNHDPATLPGQQVLCVTDLDSVRIAGFESEALTLGVPDAEGTPVLVAPTDTVPLGGELY